MHASDWLNAMILGVVEGLTEFLPISSTGHMLLVQRGLGLDPSRWEIFTVFIQLGALASVWWLFRHRILGMIPRKASLDLRSWRLAIQVAFAFLPIMVFGLATHRWIKTHLFSVPMIAAAFIIGGVAILLVERFRGDPKIETLEALPTISAIMVGLGQCLALWPGISRSGATIVTGLVVGMSRPVATEFTFLLAVPTMTAASVYELCKYRHDLSMDMAGLLAIGFITAFVSAWAVVKWFIGFVQNHTFRGFAWYRILAGATLLGLFYRGFFNPSLS